jgi:phage terminase large subunit-like protein
LHVPDGFDLSWYLRRLNARNDSGRLLADYSSEFRRGICAKSPLMWALVYFPHCLRSAETGGVMSLSPMHLDAAAGAKTWMRSDLPAKSERWVTIGPRGGAKTEWYFKILPSWAMAYRHRKYLVAVTASDPMAAQQLDNLRDELATNERLNADFPSFCTPLRGAGKAYRAANGTAMMARGVGAATLGAKVGSTRPDLILIDDPEKDEGSFSPEESEKRLKSIRQGLLGMNDKAVVHWCGTTTAYGCLAHSFVRHAKGEHTEPWIREDGWRVRYYPALRTAPDGSESSLWPQRWPLEELQAGRYSPSGELNREFALNMMNDPVGADGKFWTREDFRYGTAEADAWVMWVDPAVTANQTSDFTGLAIVGRLGDQCVVRLAEGMRDSVDAVRARVHQLVRLNPALRLVVVENNQGGMLWERALGPLPNKAVLRMARAKVGKAERFADVHRLYREGRVVHSRPHRVLEDQACAYPSGRNDDVLDAACGAILYLMEEK